MLNIAFVMIPSKSRKRSAQRPATTPVSLLNAALRPVSLVDFLTWLVWAREGSPADALSQFRREVAIQLQATGIPLPLEEAMALQPVPATLDRADG